MQPVKRLFHGTVATKVAEEISRIYRGFVITWLDRIHQKPEGDKIAEQFVDKYGADLKSKNVSELLIR